MKGTTTEVSHPETRELRFNPILLCHWLQGKGVTCQYVRFLVQFWLPFLVGAEQDWSCGSQNKPLPALPGGSEALGSAKAAFAGLPAGLCDPAPSVHSSLRLP